MESLVTPSEDKPFELAKDISNVENKELTDCLSGDISVISEIICLEQEQHIKK